MLDALGPHGLGQQTLTEFLGFGVRHCFEVLANLGARPPGAHKAQPRRVGRGDWGGDHFHHVAIFQLGAQGDGFAVDAGAHRTVAHVAVNGVGEIDNGGPTRHGHDLALGREHIHRIGKEVHFDVVPELGSVAGFVLNVQKRLQPLRTQPIRCRAVGIFDLVEPVGRYTRFRHDVHGFGAHLKLHVDP